MSNKKQYLFIIQLGIKQLAEFGYRQNQICDLLKDRGIKTSESTLSNCVTELKLPSINTQKMLNQGIQDLVKIHCGMIYQSDAQDFVKADEKQLNNFQPQFVPPTPVAHLSNDTHRFLNGRKGASNKIELYQTAKKEVIELGIRLHRFSTYFTQESDALFKLPILRRLRTGVHFHCYILQPNGRIAQPYFKDRAHLQPNEIAAFQAMPDIRNELIDIFGELNQQTDRGKMHLYQYDSFPYQHATVIDGNRIDSQMYITQYLYGTLRSKSPSFLLIKRKQPEIYQLYYQAIQATIQRAEQIVI